MPAAMPRDGSREWHGLGEEFSQESTEDILGDWSDPEDEPGFDNPDTEFHLNSTPCPFCNDCIINAPEPPQIGGTCKVCQAHWWWYEAPGDFFSSFQDLFSEDREEFDIKKLHKCLGLLEKKGNVISLVCERDEYRNEFTAHFVKLPSRPAKKRLINKSWINKTIIHNRGILWLLQYSLRKNIKGFFKKIFRKNNTRVFN